MADQVTELPVEALRQVCDPAQFTFRSTEELSPMEEIIGQDRAVRAITFGIDIKTPDYHLFALGPSGTGKTTTIQKFLEREASTRPVPDDWLYVNNFTDPDKPRALCLPAGMGCKLRADMDKLVDELRREVPRAFESAEYGKQQEQLGEDLQKRRQAMLQEVDEFAKSHGFVILQTPQGFMLAPVVNGNVTSPEQLQQLPEDKRHEYEAHSEEIGERMREAMRNIQQLHREANERVNELDRRTLSFAIEHLLDELKESYAQFEAVVKLLDEMKADILENVATFKQIRQMEQMQAEQGPLAAMMGRQIPSFDQYKVNLIVNNCETKGAPVILARNPSYHNLIGRIEHQGQFGTLVTNFNFIKGGLLHKANGGYLMLDIRDVLTKPLAWEGLKRALKNQLIEMESLAEAYGLFATRTIDPEPVPLNIKVVLIGEPMIYYLLFFYDPDFRDLFKVKVDFAIRMDRTPETSEQYARFIATVCKEEGLLPFDPTGVARVIEHGSRLVEHQKKLVTKFGDIVDLVRQSSFWAGKNGHALVTAADVTQTIAEKVYRSNQIQQYLQEAIAEGTLLIDTQGERLGQVNGLAVLSLGDYAFGKPSRISARIHVGSKGVVNIDREVKLGGPIHNKGTMILSGFLGGKYASEVPLALSATITFEQTYEEVEGDSASSAELYTLLSALSGFPARQDLAITGSVNQYGEVQAIGGVNEKIEGYFDICRLVGLSGTQGVMIPRSNVKHLMLREDVLQAAREGQFHIYPITTIDEGIALLTGKEAGERGSDGMYPPGTVNAEVQRHLRELAQKVKDFVAPEGKSSSDDAEEGSAPDGPD
ncbi:MAG TPA: ATP-binding protein [Armatimonadota bacterium]